MDKEYSKLIDEAANEVERNRKLFAEKLQAALLADNEARNAARALSHAKQVLAQLCNPTTEILEDVVVWEIPQATEYLKRVFRVND